MKLTCPDCQTFIPAEDVNIQLGIGKCMACDSVFSLVDQTGLPLTSLRSNLPLAAPKHWRIEDFGSELTITWRWYSHGIWFLVLFAFIWDGFLVVWYSIAINELLTKGSGSAIFGLLFPMLHVAVGLVITYVVLATLFNRTVVQLRYGELSIYQGPLPGWGNRRLPVMDICQLFCSEVVNHRKKGYSYSYNLNALLKNGERVCLLKNFQEPSEPLYLERTLEDRLKIADERVPGDWVG